MEPIHLRRGLVQHYSYSAGFTLIELMVVLAIVATVTAVVLTSQSSFNKTLILANTAYDIELTLRSVQTYGISSRAVGNIATAGYGAHFQSGITGTFIVFADTFPSASCETPDCKPGDKIYESGSDTRVQTYTLGNGMTISNFCAFSGSWSCASGGGLSSMDIVFARPNPDSFVSTNGSYSTTFPVTIACLTVFSPQGSEKHISVAASGQMTPNASSCP